MNFEDDDPDFSLTPGARSRLSSLFQSQGPTDEDPNQALIYTAPKQPKKPDPQTAAAAGQIKLLHATAVHIYILESGKYSSQGKAGAAILGNHETSEYQLLLYKSKQQKITCCSINANFSYRVQENNYANFYDDGKVNWSIMFDSEKSSTEFAKQIALAKANSCGSNLNSTIVQDLTAGEGTVVLENGGSADVHYVGWIFSNHTLGEVFDSNMDSEKPLRLRMGKSKVIKGWSGLLGSKRGTKRLVIIPPAFAYGSEGVPDKIPPNAVVAFEFLIKKVKEAKESSSLSQSPAKGESDLLDKKPEISPKPHSQSITDDSIRMRGASISEQLMQSPKKGNATIISRMAKMGTATLPLPGAVAAQPSSESEAEDECFTKNDSPTPPVPAVRSRESSPKPIPKPRSSSGSVVVTQSVYPMPAHATHAHISHVSTSQQLPVYATATVPSHQHLVSDSFPLHVYPQATSHATFPVMQPAYAAHPLPAISPTVVPGIADSHLTLLLTETRSQNTEVRLSLSKISDKVETVLQKVEDIRSREGGDSNKSLHYMESSVLMQNIQRIVQENTRLKEEVELKNSKIQSLNEKICELLQKNQRFIEESNSYLEQKTESSITQSRILALEQEKAKLTSEVHDALSKLSVLQQNLESSNKMVNELGEKLRTSDTESKKQQELIDSLKLQTSEKENQVHVLQRDLLAALEEKKDLLQKVRSLEQKWNDLELIRGTLEKKISKKEAEVKEITERAEKQIRNLRDALEGKETATSTEALQQVLQEKEKLQNKLRDMESRYEELSSSSYKQKEKLEAHIMYMKKRMRQVMASQASPSHESDFDIKKTMNVLYRLLQAKIAVSESYDGEKVLKTCLETIRGLTVQLLEQKSKPRSTSQPEDSGNSVPHSIPAEDQKSESTSQSVSPPKSNFHDTSASDIERPESLALAASSPKINISVDYSEHISDTERSDAVLVSEETKSLTSQPIIASSTDNSQLCRTEKDDDTIHGNYTDHMSSELSCAKSVNHECESLEKSEVVQIQEEGVQEEAEQKLEPQVNSRAVLKNGDSKQVLDSQQEHANDRRTPDVWKPQPPPLPLFDDDEDDDDWLK